MASLVNQVRQGGWILSGTVEILWTVVIVRWVYALLVLRDCSEIITVGEVGVEAFDFSH